MRASMTWTERYKNAHHLWCKTKSPAFFEASGGETMKVKYPQVTSTNGLRRAICNFMQWEGHHLEPTNNMGRPIERFAPKFNLFTNTVQKISTGIDWQRGSGMAGSSDSKGHINHPKHKFGIPLYVEIKYGKDKMSDVQEEYEERINETGGVYVIAKTIDGFFLWYDSFILTL